MTELTELTLPKDKTTQTTSQRLTGMGNRLKFKGEKKDSKRKRVHHSQESTVHRSGADDKGDQDVWLNPPDQIHISGPLFIISLSPSLNQPAAISIQPSPISPVAPVRPIQLTSQSLQTLDPQDINQVWVCTRVLDSDSKVTLRASNGRYLASDQLGAVSAQSEARGSQEEWQFERTDNDQQPGSEDGIFFLRSVLYGTYLSLDQVAGPNRFEIRLLVRMQALELVKSKKRLDEQRAKRGLSNSSSATDDNGLMILSSTQSIRDLEKNNIRQYQARGSGRLVLPNLSGSNSLKKAKKQGRLAEELLDRRSKLKSDRYAKSTFTKFKVLRSQEKYDLSW
ncbi:FRG1-like family-domain-containing protein [Phakopsora pachyrhizi]|nr:FRG1-like family-domain-containing protein [Phakopsora pachyrhizi]